MPGFGRSSGGDLTDHQIDVLVQGMRSHWKHDDVFAGPDSAAVQSHAGWRRRQRSAGIRGGLRALPRSRRSAAGACRFDPRRLVSGAGQRPDDSHHHHRGAARYRPAGLAQRCSRPSAHGRGGHRCDSLAAGATSGQSRSAIPQHGTNRATAGRSPAPAPVKR